MKPGWKLHVTPYGEVKTRLSNREQLRIAALQEQDAPSKHEDAIESLSGCITADGSDLPELWVLPANDRVPTLRVWVL